MWTEKENARDKGREETQKCEKREKYDKGTYRV